MMFTMRLSHHSALGVTSPQRGEVGCVSSRVRGLRSIERPYPLTAALSPWERGLTAVGATRPTLFAMFLAWRH